MDESEQYDKICQPKLEHIESLTEKIFLILEGNGQNGLVTKVARHDERIKGLQNWKKAAVGLGLALISGLTIALIMYLVTRGGP